MRDYGNLPGKTRVPTKLGVTIPLDLQRQAARAYVKASEKICEPVPEYILAIANSPLDSERNKAIPSDLQRQAARVYMKASAKLGEPVTEKIRTLADTPLDSDGEEPSQPSANRD